MAGKIFIETGKPKMHVISEAGKWVVFREGAQKASRICSNKTEAVELAKVFARKNNIRDVVVHRNDGTVESRIDPRL